MAKNKTKEFITKRPDFSTLVEFLDVLRKAMQNLHGLASDDDTVNRANELYDSIRLLKDMADSYLLEQ